jgi:hypothetical protein
LSTTNPGHEAVRVLAQLVEEVATRPLLRGYLDTNPTFRKIHERARGVVIASGLKVRRPSSMADVYVPNFAWCETCGAYHEQVHDAAESKAVPT